MNNKLVTVFMGTPEFAVPSLRALARATDLCLVVTQPDRPAGRGRKMMPPPVKVAALELGIEVIQPTIIKGRRFSGVIAGYEPDLLVTAAFGRILKKSLLDTPKLGCLNVHASLLPAYRGAAPINWALVNGEPVTGISIMAMDEGLDTGDVYATAQTPIGPHETCGQLTGRLAELGATTLIDTLARLVSLNPVPQNNSLASHAPIIRKDHGRVDWSLSAGRIHDHVRGFHPWPCAVTQLDGENLKIHGSTVIEPDGSLGGPGEVLSHAAEGLDVACGEGVLRLLSLQLPGKKRLEPQPFFLGRKVDEGTTLG